MVITIKNKLLENMKTHLHMYSTDASNGTEAIVVCNIYGENVDTDEQKSMETTVMDHMRYKNDKKHNKVIKCFQTRNKTSDYACSCYVEILSK